jgi:hypothetical protein
MCTADVEFLRWIFVLGSRLASSEMSGAERPDRLAPAKVVTVEDIRELTGAATPHFALQIRDRVRRLIDGLAADDPARAEGERAIERLERMARDGQVSGAMAPRELPLPSLRLERERTD